MIIVILHFSSNSQLEIPILICLYCASGRQIKKKSISSLNIICFQREVIFEKKMCMSIWQIIIKYQGRWEREGQGGHAPSPRDIEDNGE